MSDMSATRVSREFVSETLQEFVESLHWAGRWTKPMRCPDIYKLYCDWAKYPMTQRRFAHALNKVAQTGMILPVMTYKNRPSRFVPSRARREKAEATLL